MDEMDSAFLVGFIAAIAVIILVWLAVMVFFLLTLQKTLKAIQPQNRRMAPGEVWLQLIPLFGTIWAFITVNRIADSIDNELNTNQFSFENGGFDNSGLYTPKERPTRSIGLAYCICFVCGIVPFVGSFATLGGIVCWIMYWVEVNKYRKIIEQRRFEQQLSLSQTPAPPSPSEIPSDL